jgi:hypothetical protein
MAPGAPFLAYKHTVLGRIKPGTKVERCLAGLVPTDTPAGAVEIPLLFHEANGYAPAELPARFEVRPLPRPDLPLYWHFINDGSGHSFGEGDGRPRRGESIDIEVTMENQTGEDLDGLYLTLAPVQVPSGVIVNVGRADLEKLPDGGRAEDRLTFSIKPRADAGLARLELRLQSLDGRTFAIVPIETSIQ